MKKTNLQGIQRAVMTGVFVAVPLLMVLPHIFSFVDDREQQKIEKMYTDKMQWMESNIPPTRERPDGWVAPSYIAQKN